MSDLSPKTVPEIKAKLRDLLHRSCTAYIKKANIPCPENCAYAPKVGNRVQPCRVCGAKPGEPCKIDSQFKARYTFDELKQMFRELIRNREWLLRNDRGIAMLLWVLNQLDPSEEPSPKPLAEEDPPAVWVKLEGNTVTMSPEAVPLLQTLLNRLPDLIKDSTHDETLDRGTLGKRP